MIDFRHLEVWFLTGSQHLYGEETLATVARHSAVIAQGLSDSPTLPVKIIHKPVLTTPDAIAQMCGEANAAAHCIGVIAWMHTFSPAKMWIRGLSSLQKPLAHLHTQFNRDLPWSSIDMDFMNLNQSAHGDREFGFLGARMDIERKVVVGFWQDADCHARLAAWSRAAAAWHDAAKLKVARFGDNMREVAVTEGDKVSAQIHLRYSVNGYGVGDLAASIRQVEDRAIDKLVTEYNDLYSVAAALQPSGDRHSALRDAARIELGLRAFLTKGAFGAFTDTFEDLHGLEQLPGIAAQRLMADGYGFAGEGDWKTAALVRAVKVMAHGLPGGTSFMEDYTYHFGGSAKVLGAHMLEICPSIADAKPAVEIHPLSIGGKSDPVRLVFTAPAGPAINVSVIDMGSRFRMIVNEVDVVSPDEPLPKLPVARALWTPRPDLATAAAAWIYAGGAHHTAFSQAIDAEPLRDFAAMAGIEYLNIDAETRVHHFRNELRWNDAYYALRRNR
ncbi:MAG TPA: L-arabinose isomerase [Bryobacteraceae bacterium]|nr:L-arabinose isomerase [Bryobacteraceae bacterium]